MNRDVKGSPNKLVTRNQETEAPPSSNLKDLNCHSILESSDKASSTPQARKTAPMSVPQTLSLQSTKLYHYRARTTKRSLVNPISWIAQLTRRRTWYRDLGTLWITHLSLPIQEGLMPLTRPPSSLKSIKLPGLYKDPIKWNTIFLITSTTTILYLSSKTSSTSSATGPVLQTPSLGWTALLSVQFLIVKIKRPL